MAEEIGPPRSIDWNAFLDSPDAEVLITCFSESFLDVLSMYLNMDMAVQIKGLWPNWHGLADFIGFERMEISDIERNNNPGREVIERWKKKRKSESSVGNLVRHLLSLEREDILTDLGHKLLEEAKERLTLNTEVEEAKKGTFQDHRVRFGGGGNEQKSQRLTPYDTSTYIAFFDAFISYDEGDSSFVEEMTCYLETKGFKLCNPYRDTLIGGDFFEMITRIISERCRHMIVVLSKNFIQSEMCRFQCSYAFSLNPDARRRQIVPIQIEKCQIPQILRIIGIGDFTSHAVLDWSWTRLENSIQRLTPNSKFVGAKNNYLSPLNSSCPSSSSSLSASRYSSSGVLQSSRSSDSNCSAPETEREYAEFTGTKSNYLSPQNSSCPSSSSSLSASRYSSSVALQSSRSSDTNCLAPETERDDAEACGYDSGISSTRPTTSSSSRYDPSVVGQPSGPHSPSKIKARAAKTFKMIFRLRE